MQVRHSRSFTGSAFLGSLWVLLFLAFIPGCETRSREELFRDVFGLSYPTSWVVVEQYKNESTPQTFYYRFKVAPSDINAWKPGAQGFSAWQPMTAEQRFNSAGYVVEGSRFSSSAMFHHQAKIQPVPDGARSRQP